MWKLVEGSDVWDVELGSPSANLHQIGLRPRAAQIQPWPFSIFFWDGQIQGMGQNMNNTWINGKKYKCRCPFGWNHQSWGEIVLPLSWITFHLNSFKPWLQQNITNHKSWIHQLHQALPSYAWLGIGHLPRRILFSFKRMFLSCTTWRTIISRIGNGKNNPNILTIESPHL